MLSARVAADSRVVDAAEFSVLTPTLPQPLFAPFAAPAAKCRLTSSNSGGRSRRSDASITTTIEEQPRALGACIRLPTINASSLLSEHLALLLTDFSQGWCGYP